MKYFKEIETGEVFAYSIQDLDRITNRTEETPTIFHKIAENLKGMEELAGEALELKLNPPPTTEQLAEQVRAERDAKIESVRWRIERAKDELELGVPLTEPLEPLLQYVQALRDVPQQEGFPTDIVWPESPIESDSLS